MKHLVVAGGLLALVSAPVFAETLGERLKGGLQQIGEGAQEVGRALGDGAQDVGRAVGDGAANVAGAVDETITSTTALIEGEATPAETRAVLDAMAEESLSRLLADTPEARALFETSAGYAVFDTRKVTLVGLTGGGGRGVAVAPDGARIYMKMATAGVGLALGLGGFETQVVIFFEQEANFISFVTDGLDASAEAGTMFNEEREDLRAEFIDGRAMFYVSKRGWRVAATAAGTRYWRDAALN